MGTEPQNQRNLLCGRVISVLPLLEGISLPILTLRVVLAGWMLAHVARLGHLLCSISICENSV